MVVSGSVCDALTSAPVSTARWLEATWTDEFSGTELGRQWSTRGREHGMGNRRSVEKAREVAAAAPAS